MKFFNDTTEGYYRHIQILGITIYRRIDEIGQSFWKIYQRVGNKRSLFGFSWRVHAPTSGK